MDKSKEFINEELYLEVATLNDVSISVVKDVLNYEASFMASTIRRDDANVSVKLDYLGNLHSKPKRREHLEKDKEKKDGRPITISRR